MFPTDEPHYTLSITNHQTGKMLRVEMIDLPFPRSCSNCAPGVWRIELADARQASACDCGRPWEWQSRRERGSPSERSQIRRP